MKKEAKTEERLAVPLRSRPLVGLLHPMGTGAVLLLDRPDADFGSRLRIAPQHLHGAPFGMKVTARFLGMVKRQAFGEVQEVLGDPERPDVAITSIMASYGLPRSFPAAALSAAAQFPLDPSAEDIAAALAAGRRDLRELPTFTMDGLDARDLDDAVSLLAAEMGFVLYVHIADVSHYLRQSPMLDREAAERGNSVYLVDRVLPMLPPRLSNGLCSLNPGRDRLTLTVELHYDRQGQLLQGDLYESLIRSDVRTSYEEAMAWFGSQEGEKRGAAESSWTGSARPLPANPRLPLTAFPEDRPDWFYPTLDKARELAAALHAGRARAGSLIFRFPETRVELDDDGVPQRIYGLWPDEAHGLIEAFMVAANSFVASYCEEHSLAAIYRVHEAPDPQKVRSALLQAKRQGVSVRVTSAPRPRLLRGVLEQLLALPAGEAVSDLILRALAKARYTGEDLGHYGLALEHYLHFTSPIRRYADDVVHRAVKGALHGSAPHKKKRSGLESLAEHLSQTERVADMAERDCLDQKICEYYADRLGEELDGVICGFSSFAFFVELSNTAQGAVLFRDMAGGFLRYNPERMEAIDTHSGEVFALGDRVRVQVAKVDLLRRFLDFRLLEHHSR